MSVLKKPHNTEKMVIISERIGDGPKQYAFIVDRDASKPQIKAAIEKLYEVKVKNIRTMITRGKSRSRFTKSNFILGSSAARKKAVVTLQEGQSIDFYKNI
jgi:large subunit ribosomal protein L23